MCTHRTEQTNDSGAAAEFISQIYIFPHYFLPACPHPQHENGRLQIQHRTSDANLKRVRFHTIQQRKHLLTNYRLQRYAAG